MKLKAFDSTNSSHLLIIIFIFLGLQACSNIKEFSEFTENPNLFKNVIPETEKIADSSRVKKVVLCSGQVYWDLYIRR